METEILSYPTTEQLGYEACRHHVLRELETGEPFILVAESFSGPVAVSAAAEEPDGLRGLVMCNTFIENPLWGGLRFLPLEAFTGLRHNRISVGVFLVGAKNTGRWLEPVRAANRLVNPAVMANRIREVLRVDVRETFASLRIPVLWLRGKRDRLIGPWSLSTAVRYKPRMDVAEVDGPHLLLQVEPEACWREIAGFVAKRIVKGRNGSC